MKKLKRFIIVLLVLLAAFAVYVEIVNRNSKNMTYRQKILKAAYPAIMWLNKLTGSKSKKMENTQVKPPVTSFYDLKAKLSDGSELSFSTLKGKKVLLVNTASDCGYTNQYDDLQRLYNDNSSKLVVIAFPANDFKEQEKGTDADIAAFCKKNYGISFPLAQKSVVVQSAEQNPVFQWLTDSTKNGWCNQFPTWNFSKYLVNEEGVLTNYFDPGVSPANTEIRTAIRK